MKKLIVVLLMLCSGVFGLIGGLVLGKDLYTNLPVEASSSNQESKAATAQPQNPSPAPVAEKTPVVENKKIESQSKPATEAKPSAPKQLTQKEKIAKAKAAMIKECGKDFQTMQYSGTRGPERFTGKYYIFDEDGADISIFVDQNTYKVYRYGADGVFDTYKEKPNEFTYDMAFMKLEKEIGYEEDRVYTLVSKGSDRGTPAYTIRTSFNTQGGSGTGSLYYVTKYYVKHIDN